MIQSVVKFSQVEDRFDAEYYEPEYLNLQNKLANTETRRLGEFLENYHTGFPFESTMYRDKGMPLIRITNLNNWFYDGSYDVTLPDLKEWHKFRTNKNDILISMSGTVGLASIVLEHEGFFVNQRIADLKIKGISPLFVLAVLNSMVGRLSLERIGTGGVQTNVRIDDIKNITIPIFGKTTTDSIANLIDQSWIKKQLAQQKYAGMEEFVDDLLKLKKHDLGFRSAFSVPYSKVENRFDSEYYQPKYLRAVEVLKQSAYKTVRLGDVSSKIRYGSSEKVIYQNKGVPFLRVTDIDDFCTIETGEGKFISKHEAEDLRSYSVEENDLLISRSGTLGYVVCIDKGLVGSIFGSYFIKVTPKKDSPPLPLFVAIFLNSTIGRMQTERASSGGIQTNLTIETIKDLTIPVFSKEEQTHLCRLYGESITARRESKALLEEAKHKVEELIN